MLHVDHLWKIEKYNELSYEGPHQHNKSHLRLDIDTAQKEQEKYQFMWAGGKKEVT